MGKKRSCFFPIRRVFTHSSKDRPNESERKTAKEKKKTGFGKLKHGERNSFIPLFGKPSSIEKILADAESERNIIFRPPTPASDEPRIPPFLLTRVASEVRAETESLIAESPSAESFRAESFRAKSVRPESLRSESLKAESHRVESLRAESPSTESLRAESVRPESLRPESHRAQSLRAKSPRVGSLRAESARVESLRPETLRAGSPTAESLRVESLTAESPLVWSPLVASPRESDQYHRPFHSYRPEPTLRNQHASATKIQAVYRGYTARRSCRALRGLVRLQGVVRGQNVQRQTANAIKQLQKLVRVQTQIQSQRVHKTDKEHVESTFGRGTSSQAEEDWKDSVLTKEQLDAMMQRKVEAAIKRERAMAYAYAYSHKLGKAISSSAQPEPVVPMSSGSPWWWNWLERQSFPLNPPDNQSIKNAHLIPAPPRSVTGYKASPRPQSSNHRQHSFELNPVDAFTPKSTRSTFTPRWKQPETPTSGSRCPMKDDDSLISCPPFSSVPNYMTLTASARAKSRAYYSNPNQRFQGTAPTTPNSISNGRLSLPAAHEFGSFRLNKGTQFFNDKDSISSRMSVDSTLSFGAPRKPFNRFV